MARNRSKGSKKRRSGIRGVCTFVFGFSVVFYGGAKVGLYSYNITLQQKEQSLASEIARKKSEVEDLQAQVHSMQDKGRVLSMLGEQVQDNSGNIYVIGDSGQ